MSQPYHIHYLTRKDVLPEKWDACINLIYGKSYYLDHMTDGQWDALILEDYEAVMPLVWKKKWGVRYCYQPAFTQQLGIFSADIPSTGLIEAFLSQLQKHYRFAEIFLNYTNACPGLKPYTNFILDLNAPYEELAANYRKDLKKNLKEASLSSFQYTDDPDLLQTLSLFRQQYGPRLPHVKEEAYTRFQTLCSTLQKKGQLLLRCVRDQQQQLLATALLPRDKNRLYLLQSTILPAGRQGGANHFLLDRLIREFAEQPLWLDFEGSEEPGIAHFYRNFGAKDQPYFFYRHNRLPWPLKYLK